jgi:hypothetical protein
MICRITLCTLVLVAAGASTAMAGTLSVSADRSTITYQAAPGEANFVTVNWGNVSAGPDYIPKIDDHAPITAIPPCVDDALDGHCDVAGPNPRIVVLLGDGNDHAASINDHALGHSIEFYGEDGDDDLESGASSDLLDGGNGNDTLSPDDDDAGPRDVVVGGPGIDTLWTGDGTGVMGPIGVSFDGVANDGYPGEGDNYAPDLENLQATAVSPSINFVGTDGPNVVQLRSEAADTVQGLGGDDTIDGANGNDILDGGAGNDTIFGGGNDDTITGGPGVDSMNGEGSGSGLYISVAGNDRIDARDGVAEQLNCGPGADIAIVDAIDVVPQDPGSLCEQVDRGAPPATAKASVKSSSLKVSKNRFTVKVGCTGAACKGKLTVKTAAKKPVTVGSASYSIAAGKTANVRVKLTSKGRSLMRRSKKLRVKVAVTGTKAKTITLRR